MCLSCAISLILPLLGCMWLPVGCLTWKGSLSGLYIMYTVQTVNDLRVTSIGRSYSVYDLLLITLLVVVVVPRTSTRRSCVATCCTGRSAGRRWTGSGRCTSPAGPDSASSCTLPLQLMSPSSSAHTHRWSRSFKPSTHLSTNRTSLRSYLYVRWKRGTTRICCYRRRAAASTAVQHSIDIFYLPAPQSIYSSKPAARRCSERKGQTDGHCTVSYTLLCTLWR